MNGTVQPEAAVDVRQRQLSEDLTTWEWAALHGEHDLAGGYAFRQVAQAQRDLVERLPAIYLKAEGERPAALQDEFAKVFFDLAGQPAYARLAEPMYHFSSTLATEAVVNYLRLTNRSVALIHPIVDTIPALLKRHAVDFEALAEDGLRRPLELRVGPAVDTLLLVCPNNPTGFEMSRGQFQDLVTFCQKRKLMLVLDFSFRFFSSYAEWDQYALLADSGVDFVALEDTGKTWPTLGLKLGVMAASDSVYAPLRRISDEFRLNVSPFVFALLTEYLSIERARRPEFTFRQVVDRNRRALRSALAGTPLTPVAGASRIGVELVQLPAHWDAAQFCVWLVKTYGVYALPTAHFFWHDPAPAQALIRIALLRPEPVFDQAVSQLRTACLEYAQHVAAG